jgi:hypothetical protein
MLPKKWTLCGLFALWLAIGPLWPSCLVPAALAQPPCPEGEECEPNSRFGDATVLAAMGPAEGRISPAGDADWVAFTAESAGELHVAITQVAPELDINFRVWNSNKDTISGWFAPSGKGSDTNGVVDLPAPGRYYLELAAGDGSASSEKPYVLQLTLAAARDPFEPNNSFGTASAIDLERSYEANIFPLGDADWYRVRVDLPGELRVAVTNVPQDMDIAVRIWNGNKDPISGYFAPLSRGGSTSASIDLPEPGEYFLEVADGGNDVRSVQPYTLQVTFVASGNDEPNNAFNSATPLTFGQPHSASILPQGDTDWYRVQVDGPGEMQVAVTAVPADLDVDFRVWNANKDTISGWFAPLAKGGNTIGSQDLPAPGRYYIEMADGNQDARSTQSFTVTAVFTPAADLFEPNGSFGEAGALPLDDERQINILPQGDADWLYVEVPHQGQLTVTASKVPPAMAIAIRVWDANKDTISNWFMPLAPGGDTTAVLDVPSAGRYFLEVSDNQNQRSIQPFSLKATFMPAADRGEPNNSIETATPITLDSTVAANILPTGDRDWYAFEVAAAGQLHVLATRVAPELDIVYRVYDSNQQLIRDWFAPLAKGGDTTATVDIPAPGRYYLEVADGYDDTRAIQPYLLYLSMRPIDPASVTVPAVVTPTVGLTPTTGITATTTVTP